MPMRQVRAQHPRPALAVTAQVVPAAVLAEFALQVRHQALHAQVALIVEVVQEAGLERHATGNAVHCQHQQAGSEDREESLRGQAEFESNLRHRGGH
ncbi:hypothetical protein G6F32_015693 [Rhizopus arrhizus]|nr:hypothetical protein G6F32_015693 [Rhizopus arrhizus]